MATTTTQRTLTLEEFLKLPERKPALEFEEGRIRQKVSPKAKHNGLQAGVVELVNGFARRRRLAFAFPELRSSYHERSYVPDVSIYRWERVPLDEHGEPVNDFFHPPDIAVEILSPRQRIARLLNRCRWYVENGAQIALLIDQPRSTVQRFVPGEAPQILTGADRIDLDAVLPGFRLTVQELFDYLRFDALGREPGAS